MSGKGQSRNAGFCLVIITGESDIRELFVDRRGFMIVRKRTGQG